MVSTWGGYRSIYTLTARPASHAGLAIGPFRFGNGLVRRHDWLGMGFPLMCSAVQNNDAFNPSSISVNSYIARITPGSSQSTIPVPHM